MPVRVLNLFTIMNRGGAETMVMNYYRNINRDKVQFDFLVHRDEKGAYDDEIRSLGGKIYHAMPIYPQNFRKYKRFLKEFFEEHRHEYKIIHSHMSELGYFAFKEAKRQGIPVRICHAHNAPHDFDLKMLVRNYFKYAMRKYITHRFVCGYDAGVWLYGKRYKDHFIMLNNAIDSEKFSYSENRSLKMKQANCLSSNLVVGHVGRFNKQKNHLFLIDIFKEICKKESQAILLLVGDGEDRKKVEEYVSKLGIMNKVIFLGNRTDVQDLLQMFDIFLFPSLYEGLSVALVEAQAAGLPCFISDSIPKQCMITKNIWAIKLQASSEKWAEFILNKYKTFERKNMIDQIKEAGFDIKHNARWLEEFYINEDKQ